MPTEKCSLLALKILIFIKDSARADGFLVGKLFIALIALMALNVLCDS